MNERTPSIAELYVAARQTHNVREAIKAVAALLEQNPRRIAEALGFPASFGDKIEKAKD
jgi:hypothetical protein